MEKKPISHFSGGLVVGCIMIIYTIIINFSGLGADKTLGYINYVFLIGGIIYFITAYGKSVDHTASFGSLFTFGFKMSALITIIVVAFQVIFFLIFPEFKEKIFDAAHDAMVKKPNITEEQIEMGMTAVKKFFWIIVVGGSVFGLVFVGALASLIGAGITKKRPQSPFHPTVQ